MDDVVSCVDVCDYFGWSYLLDTSSKDIILVLCYSCATLCDFYKTILVVIGVGIDSVRFEVTIGIVGVTFVHFSTLTRVLVEYVCCVATVYIRLSIPCLVVGVEFCVLINASCGYWSRGDETSEWVVGVGLCSITCDETTIVVRIIVYCHTCSPIYSCETVHGIMRIAGGSSVEVSEGCESETRVGVGSKGFS